MNNKEQDIVEFNIKVKMKKRWVNHFCSMLNKMEKMGGTSRVVGLYADGDGDFHPKFNFDANFEEVKPYKEDGTYIFYDAG